MHRPRSGCAGILLSVRPLKAYICWGHHCAYDHCSGNHGEGWVRARENRTPHIMRCSVRRVCGTPHIMRCSVRRVCGSIIRGVPLAGPAEHCILCGVPYDRCGEHRILCGVPPAGPAEHRIICGVPHFVVWSWYLNHLHCIPSFRVYCHTLSWNVDELPGDVWWG